MQTAPYKARKRLLESVDILIVICFSVIPLFLHFPYRVNIYLSWEGAYRLYLGQIPYKDFGLPMGIGFWLVPAVFFKMFGPYLISLVKAQVLLNILAGLSFRSILKKLNVSGGVRVLSVLVFSISYILMNFWPWYNNSVIIWEIVGLNFLLAFIVNTTTKWRYVQLIVASFFLFLSFFTKQDGGFLAFVVAVLLLSYQAVSSKKWKDLLLFLVYCFAIAILVILPFTRYGFGYWFNHGQPPHSSRLSVGDILDELFGGSQWLKFYVLLIILLLLLRVSKWKQLRFNTQEMLFLLLTVGILGEAAIFQVTSYTPPDNDIFFHSFAFAYIITGFERFSGTDLSRFKNFFFLLIAVLFWWSGMYWKYIERVFPPSRQQRTLSATGENIINKNTYMLNTDTTQYEDESTWTTVPGLKAFQKIKLPPSTVAGIERLVKMPVFADTANVKVLNMTELTPLDYELKYKLETSPDIPLWYHWGVAIFNRQINAYCQKIKDNRYDVVMYEYIPSLNNFYPFKVRDTLQRYYRQVDSFLAPRRPTNGYIEVYIKK